MQIFGKPAPPARREIARLFISYSREDRVVADNLVTGLEAEGFVVRIDRRDLPIGEEWAKQIERFVAEADITVWLVTEHSLKSEWCQWELGLASSLHKKVIPVVIAAVDLGQLPVHLGKLHVLPSEGVFEPGRDFSKLIAAIELDLDWVVTHSRLSERALDWASKLRPAARLQRGDALDEAIHWLKRPLPWGSAGPSAIVVEYVAEGRRRRAVLRQRWLSAAMLLIAVFGFGIFLIEQQRLRAETETKLKLAG